MSFIKNIYKEIKNSRSAIFFILGASIAILSPVLFLNIWKGIPITILTSDPSVIGGIGPHVGFLSQLGIFFWASASAICFFTAYSISTKPNVGTVKPFFLSSGLLSLLLGIDDVFLLHERIFPHIGIPQELVMVAYAALVLIWLIKFYPFILRSEFTLLFISLLFFGLSILVDLIKLDIPGRLLLEDGAKLVGIVSWLTYFFNVGVVAISTHYREICSR